MNKTVIERKSKEVLDAVGKITIPIDLHKIAAHYSISISEAPNEDDLSGLLLRSKGRTIIGTNSLHSENRRRFTIAHEFGHFFLHEAKDTFVDNKESVELIKFRHKGLPQSMEEREANCFAAALLMPQALLKKHFESAKELLDEAEELIRWLAKKYGVSEDAMRYRLSNLNLIQEN